MYWYKLTCAPVYLHYLLSLFVGHTSRFRVRQRVMVTNQLIAAACYDGHVNVAFIGCRNRTSLTSGTEDSRLGYIGGVCTILPNTRPSTRYRPEETLWWELSLRIYRLTKHASSAASGGHNYPFSKKIHTHKNCQLHLTPIICFKC